MGDKAWCAGDDVAVFIFRTEVCLSLDLLYDRCGSPETDACNKEMCKAKCLKMRP